MSKTVFALLLGNKEGEPADLYQQLQQKEALAHADPAGLKVEVACAPGFDQYRRISFAGRKPLWRARVHAPSNRT